MISLILKIYALTVCKKGKRFLCYIHVYIQCMWMNRMQSHLETNMIIYYLYYLYTCSTCKDANVGGVYAQGKCAPPTGWKKEYLSRHLSSAEHQDALKKPRHQHEGEVAFEQFHAHEEEIIPPMVNILWLCKENIAPFKAKGDEPTGTCTCNDIYCLGLLKLTHGVTLAQHHRSKNYSWEFILILLKRSYYKS